MHEEALFRDLRTKLLSVSREERARAVGRAAIWLGALSHVSEGRLREAWPEIVRGTPAEGSELDVTVSEDPNDPRANAIVLRSLVVSEPGVP